MVFLGWFWYLGWYLGWYQPNTNPIPTQFTNPKLVVFGNFGLVLEKTWVGFGLVLVFDLAKKIKYFFIGIFFLLAQLINKTSPQRPTTRTPVPYHIYFRSSPSLPAVVISSCLKKSSAHILFRVILNGDETENDVWCVKGRERVFLYF